MNSSVKNSRASSPPGSRRSSLKDGFAMEDLRSWAITMLQAYGDSEEAAKKANDATDVSSMNDLLRAARDGGDQDGSPSPIGKVKFVDRVRENDPELQRLDLSASLMKEMSEAEKQDFLFSLPHNETVSIVHLSGLSMMDCLTKDEFVLMVEAVGQLKNLEELFVFRGGNPLLTEELLGRVVEAAEDLKVLMIWGYGTLGSNPDFAGVLRRHSGLQRLTITLPKKMEYSCMDIYVMGFSEMTHLHCLNLRGSGKQQEPVISPEAMSVLLGSKSIESLYLENLGLIDDHTDAICAELRENQSLGLLDLKDNFLSDDALYSFAQALPHNRTLQSLDLSGVQVSDRAGQALAEGLSANTTLTHLELEGTAAKYADEFDIKTQHHDKEWFKAIDYQLRLNRAGTTGNRKKFVEALNSVSDHLGCLYTFVRQSPQYCDRNVQSQQQMVI